jgi:hypothetical protein
MTGLLVACGAPRQNRNQRRECGKASGTSAGVSELGQGRPRPVPDQTIHTIVGARSSDASDLALMHGSNLDLPRLPLPATFAA